MSSFESLRTGRTIDEENALHYVGTNGAVQSGCSTLDRPLLGYIR